jgi:hypothetical protein
LHLDNLGSLGRLSPLPCLRAGVAQAPCSPIYTLCTKGKVTGTDIKTNFRGLLVVGAKSLVGVRETKAPGCFARVRGQGGPWFSVTYAALVAQTPCPGAGVPDPIPSPIYTLCIKSKVTGTDIKLWGGENPIKRRRIGMKFCVGTHNDETRRPKSKNSDFGSAGPAGSGRVARDIGVVKTPSNDIGLP